ncbi:MAG: hypothetical protein HMLIMOIP_000744 [Candidatus Nitrosomirales archaeon]|jgi:hypothetical protein
MLVYGGMEIQLPPLLSLVAVTSLLYCGGMALNDYFDYRSDVTEHPRRVIPSGRIKRTNAGIFGFSVLIVACIVASFNGIASIGTAILISVLIILYNKFSKKILIIGALNMATIRFLNVILGTSATVSLAFGLEGQVILGALAVFMFVFGITMISRKEYSPLRSIAVPPLVLIAAVIAYVLTLHTIGEFPHHYIGIFITAFAFLSLLPYLRKDAKVEQLVGSFVISIILLDAALIAGTGQIFFAIIVALLYIPSFALSRVIKVS